MRLESDSPEGMHAPPSKRGARRLIQRAFVLMGRDRVLRQKLRSVVLTACWRVDDWDLDWTVKLAAGRFEFHRGHVGHAHVRVGWACSADLLQHLSHGAAPAEGFQLECAPAARRHAELVVRAFLDNLRRLMAHPVDDRGVRLVERELR